MRIHEVTTTSATHFRALLTSPICQGNKRLNLEIIIELSEPKKVYRGWVLGNLDFGGGGGVRAEQPNVGVAIGARILVQRELGAPVLAHRRILGVRI